MIAGPWWVISTSHTLVSIRASLNGEGGGGGGNGIIAVSREGPSCIKRQQGLRDVIQGLPPLLFHLYGRSVQMRLLFANSRNSGKRRSCGYSKFSKY